MEGWRGGVGDNDSLTKVFCSMSLSEQDTLSPRSSFKNMKKESSPEPKEEKDSDHEKQDKESSEHEKSESKKDDLESTIRKPPSKRRGSSDSTSSSGSSKSKSSSKSSSSSSRRSSTSSSSGSKRPSSPSSVSSTAFAAKYGDPSRDFFRKVRARLPKSDFKKFIANMQSGKDRSTILADAKVTFGEENRDLYDAFKALLKAQQAAARSVASSRKE
eukprot:TRINITY_DN2042_c0_g2_i2.p2 TRINITY_DN2042_c0_g2~~TRINITY_DN2042_c0_g2_i2.p2  ORF type:complete len:216 (-),score=61.62 TRINITY_DN2042_c0_g2_i2:6-653(-)